MPAYRVSSLRLTSKNLLLSAIDAVPAERKIVLLDAATVRIVDSICTLNDILDAGVYLVETVEKRRQPYPTMDAVYFVAPETGSNTSAAAIASDFSDPKKPKYRSAHIFFTDEVPNSLFQMLATSAAGPLVKTFQEVYLDFVPFEARAFHLSMPDAGARLLLPTSESSPAALHDLELMARKIVAMVVSLNELPTIRYRIEGQGARLANLVQEGIDRYAARNSSFKPLAGGELLIMDRTVDLAAPLLHEFTYQAMVHDLLEVHHDNRYDYKFSSGSKGEASARTVALDESDALWVAMRHIHIAKCSDLIIKRFNDFVKENKAAVKQSVPSKTAAPDAAESNVSSLSELKSTMNALGEFQELKAQYSLHLTIAQDCLGIFEKKKLVDVATVEQNMATGFDSEGKVVKDKENLKELGILLSRDNLSSQDKLNDSDRRSILDHAKLAEDDLNALRRLMHICNDTPIMAPNLKKRHEESEYDVSRYVPRVKTILQESVNGILDPSAFTLVKGVGRGLDSGPASAAKAAPVSLRHKAAATGPVASAISSTSVPSRSIIAFIIGGMTYSEIRSAYEVAESSKREVYIGSTHMITPKSFLQDLKSLK